MLATTVQWDREECYYLMGFHGSFYRFFGHLLSNKEDLVSYTIGGRLSKVPFLCAAVSTMLWWWSIDAFFLKAGEKHSWDWNSSSLVIFNSECFLLAHTRPNFPHPSLQYNSTLPTTDCDFAAFVDDEGGSFPRLPRSGSWWCFW